MKNRLESILSVILDEENYDQLKIGLNNINCQPKIVYLWPDKFS